MPTIGGGGGGPAVGTYLPVANSDGVVVDSTTYDDTIKGSGKLTTLVFPGDQGAIAIAVSGDAFPRWIMAASGTDGLYVGDGVHDPVNSGNSLAAVFIDGTLRLTPGNQLITQAGSSSSAPNIEQVSPQFTITSGALPTIQLVSGIGQQVVPSRDVETYTPLTSTAVAGSVDISLSPDNVTYTTVMTVTPAVNAAVTDVTVFVPAAWYLRMTATNATIGVTTIT